MFRKVELLGVGSKYEFETQNGDKLQLYFSYQEKFSSTFPKKP